MSTNLLPSTSSQRPRNLPWEMLGHIFSHCDQATLFAVSLVSFGCWELAGPILYDQVEMISFDGLASLFYLDQKDDVLSHRLQPTSSLLSRIRSLTLRISSLDQTREPRFTQPGPDDYDEMANPDLDEDDLLPPLRLLRTTLPVPLDLAHLIFSYPSDGKLEASETYTSPFTFLFILSSQLFPFISPRELVLQNDDPSSPTWGYAALHQLDTDFLHWWCDLERVVLDSQRICIMIFERGYEEIDLVTLWARRRVNEDEDDPSHKKSLELRFNFAPRSLKVVVPFKLKEFVVEGGVVKDTTELVDLKVVLRVRTEDEEVLEKEMSEMEEWMRKLMTVELV